MELHRSIRSGDQEYQYIKPFEEAKYLLCQHKSVSGLDIGDTLSESTEVTSPLGFSLALLLIGQEGKVMILEQDTVLVLDWKQKIVLPF